MDNTNTDNGFLDAEGLTKLVTLLKDYTNNNYIPKDTAVREVKVPMDVHNNCFLDIATLEPGIYSLSMPGNQNLNSIDIRFNGVKRFSAMPNATLFIVGSGNYPNIKGFICFWLYGIEFEVYHGRMNTGTTKSFNYTKTNLDIAKLLRNDNTEYYDVTNLYTPAHKKYVDDAITKAIADSSIDPGTISEEVLEQVRTMMATAFKYKGTVAEYTDLPTNAEVGDTYNITNASEYNEAGDNAVWSGTSWDVLSGMVDLSSYAKLTDLEPYAKDTDLNTYAKKTEIPTVVSAFTNDANYTDANTVDTKISNAINGIDLSVYALQTDVDELKPKIQTANFKPNELEPGYYYTPNGVSVLDYTAASYFLAAKTNFWVLGSPDKKANNIVIGVNNGSIIMASYYKRCMFTVEELYRLFNEAIRVNTLSNYALTKTNTNTYTPTDDYHPATKKYVDDGLSTAKFEPVITEFIDYENRDGYFKSVGTGYDVSSWLQTTKINNSWTKIHGGLVLNDWPETGWTDNKLCVIDLTKIIPGVTNYSTGGYSGYACPITESASATAVVGLIPQYSIGIGTAKIEDTGELTVYLNRPQNDADVYKPARDSAVYAIWVDVDVFTYKEA